MSGSTTKHDPGRSSRRGWSCPKAERNAKANVFPTLHDAPLKSSACCCAVFIRRQLFVKRPDFRRVVETFFQVTATRHSVSSVFALRLALPFPFPWLGTYWDICAGEQCECRGLNTWGPGVPCTHKKVSAFCVTHTRSSMYEEAGLSFSL